MSSKIQIACLEEFLPSEQVFCWMQDNFHLLPVANLVAGSLLNVYLPQYVKVFSLM